jgi:glucosyl-3-phosphoglycerate synthase
MADFFQNGTITTLHRLTDRCLDELEAELREIAKRKPMALILPSLFSELEGPAMPGIIEELKKADYISDIVIGLDKATKEQFEYAKKFFEPLPQNVHILWNDGPRLKELDKNLKDLDLAPVEYGKGRNVWYCFGYVLGLKHIQAVGLHDCDILTYSREIPARLLYPIVSPSLDFNYSKGYYARINKNKMSGRVARLFVTPLIRSLKQLVGGHDYLRYMDSFRYPLSGEFAMSRSLIANIRIPSDWGLEVGMLSEVYRNATANKICQVDIADNYDHKHQDLSPDDYTKGLAKMSTDIAKLFYRKLATEGVTMDKAFFRTLKAIYLRKAFDFVEMYYYDAKINGLEFNRHDEEIAVEVYQKSIVDAGKTFLAAPLEVPFMPNWKRVLSAYPDFTKRLHEEVAKDI